MAILACRPAQTPPKWNLGPVDILVLAPHPDDEVLMAGGVIARAVASSRTIAVAVVTNGDRNNFLCLGYHRNGYVRERETATALSLLGLPESQIVFLGYPDGKLDSLDVEEPVATWRFDENGVCRFGDSTYADRGAGGMDAHSVWYSKPAPYIDRALEHDLAELLRRLEPKDIYVSSPHDAHADHQMTYVFLRRALQELLAHAGPKDYPLNRPPILHSALVHLKQLDCWPSVNGHGRCVTPQFPFSPGVDNPVWYPPNMPPPDERIAVPTAMESKQPDQNLKYIALQAYASQWGTDLSGDWMSAFIRRWESFHREAFLSPTELSSARGSR